jgi:hypothetical protein
MDLYIIVAIILFLLAAPKLIGFIVHYYIYWRKRNEKNSLSGQVLAYRKELKNISQVDEFAKYSKIQRKLKIVEQQYNDHMRRDLELQLTYVAIGKGLSYLLTVMFCFVLVYKLIVAAVALVTVGEEITSN